MAQMYVTKLGQAVLHNPPVHSFEVDVVKLAVGDVDKSALVQDHRDHVARFAELQTNLEDED